MSFSIVCTIPTKAGYVHRNGLLLSDHTPSVGDRYIGWTEGRGILPIYTAGRR
jgi:hypothetical protein